MDGEIVEESLAYRIEEGSVAGQTQHVLIFEVSESAAYGVEVEAWLQSTTRIIALLRNGACSLPFENLYSVKLWMNEMNPKFPK